MFGASSETGIGVLCLGCDECSASGKWNAWRTEWSVTERAREAYGNGGVLGLPYSLLAFTENASSSWAMTVNCERVKPGEKAVSVAGTQIQWLFENKAEAETSVGLGRRLRECWIFLGIERKKSVCRSANEKWPNAVSAIGKMRRRTRESSEIRREV